jgi:hypothetical protein
VSGSIRIIKGSVCIISYTEPAYSADGGHALLEADKTAVHASGSATVLCAPRIILGFGPRSYSDGKNENSHREYRYSHECLLLATDSEDFKGPGGMLSSGEEGPPGACEPVSMGTGRPAGRFIL